MDPTKIFDHIAESSNLSTDQQNISGNEKHNNEQGKVLIAQPVQYTLICNATGGLNTLDVKTIVQITSHKQRRWSISTC